MVERIDENAKYELSPDGQYYMEHLKNNWENLPDMSVQDARRMWVMDQYNKGKTNAIYPTSKGVYPTFLELLHEGYIILKE